MLYNNIYAIWRYKTLNNSFFYIIIKNIPDKLNISL